MSLQRGTGLSTPLTSSSMSQFQSAEDLANYLKHFRADNIVNDAEFIRTRLVPDAGPWTILGQVFKSTVYFLVSKFCYQHVELTTIFSNMLKLYKANSRLFGFEIFECGSALSKLLAFVVWGNLHHYKFKEILCFPVQSFGGFCAVTYLSFAPQGLKQVLITGGIPPIGNKCTADSVYRACFEKVIIQNEKYYKRYPQDVEIIREVAKYLAEHGGGVRTVVLKLELIA